VSLEFDTVGTFGDCRTFIRAREILAHTEYFHAHFKLASSHEAISADSETIGTCVWLNHGARWLCWLWRFAGSLLGIETESFALLLEVTLNDAGFAHFLAVLTVLHFLMALAIRFDGTRVLLKIVLEKFASVRVAAAFDTVFPEFDAVCAIGRHQFDASNLTLVLLD